ncbi:D-alanyl-D-alanine carboxypeptidase family protein [Streptomyces sp. NPDC058682]|uniref:D-alanyl-D-alanine carboxypeptidase family protein n=1 Tax=unclassified Streptomyces TaxID=2593676 RepID=UPI00225622B3|nr:serine hydrolase [Streptomyces sp. NBC_01214]MCX4800891.1 serine hydrolase [Streptomyces sp. NBC_01214]
MRRTRGAIAVTVATGAFLVAASPASSAAPVAAPPVTAAGSILIDGTSGATLASKDADTQRQGASTTKIMTAQVVMRTPNLNYDQKITIKQEYVDYVVREGASSAHLKVGSTPTVRQLLYGLMLPSGCDAAYALADTFGKGATTQARTADFVAQMNAKAKSLGMTKTVYDSFDGISPTGKNLTTARDLAKLTKYAMSGVAFPKIVAAKTYSTGGTSTDATWGNSNLLIRERPTGYAYPGAIGVKTGTGTAAGKCLVYSATRNGKTVIGVLLNDEERYADSMKLMDWALGSSAGSGAALQRGNTDPIPDVLD